MENDKEGLGRSLVWGSLLLKDEIEKRIESSEEASQVETSRQRKQQIHSSEVELCWVCVKNKEARWPEQRKEQGGNQDEGERSRTS